MNCFEIFTLGYIGSVWFDHMAISIPSPTRLYFSHRAHMNEISCFRIMRYISNIFSVSTRHVQCIDWSFVSICSLLPHVTYRGVHILHDPNSDSSILQNANIWYSNTDSVQNLKRKQTPLFTSEINCWTTRLKFIFLIQTLRWDRTLTWDENLRAHVTQRTAWDGLS